MENKDFQEVSVPSSPFPPSNFETAIIGGGLAGLVVAIHLGKEGYRVSVIEKNAYPFHKVCGEYISNEVLQYLDRLGCSVKNLGGNSINRFRLCAPSGKYIEIELPLGGFSISRYVLEEYLYQKAQEVGVNFFLKKTVQKLNFKQGIFTLKLQNGEEILSQTCVGSFGKKSIIDNVLERPFAQRHWPYVGVKYYLEHDFPKDLVAIYNFEGGYCGAAVVEDNKLNISYLIQKSTLKKYGDLAKMEEKTLKQNPLLKEILEGGNRLNERPMVISNISFAEKEKIANHVLMAGDAAGMIPPICGNGMAMAMHAGKMAAEAIDAFLKGSLTRSQMEKQYLKQWNHAFRSRLFWGRNIQQLMGKKYLSEFAVRSANMFPFALPPIVRLTHGKPF